jgi:hypothetical protein
VALLGRRLIVPQAVAQGKADTLEDHLAHLLDRFGLDRSNWVKAVRDFGRMFRQAGRSHKFARGGGFRERKPLKPLLSERANCCRAAADLSSRTAAFKRIDA